MELLRDLSKLDKKDANIAGGKGASLGEMTKAGISVPGGFVILSNAFEKFLEDTDLNVEIDAILDSVNHEEIHTVEGASEKIKALILQAEMPQDITFEVRKFFKKLNSKYVAVRSSATAEDSEGAAWAGQLESYLNTTEETLLENVKRCWASLFTPRAIFYRFEKDLHKQKISVAVVVQKMVESEKSGIAFSVHPVTQDKNQLIIEAGFGLGEVIVSGQITPDSYVVEKQPRRIIDRNIQTQKSILSDKEILELSELVLKIEKHFGFPCDIEWAFEKDNIFIVQSRPITTLESDSGYIEFELEFTRELPISLYYIWFEGHLYANKEILKLPVEPAKRVFAIFENGIAEVHTQKDNIEKLKNAINLLDSKKIESILSSYYSSFCKLEKDGHLIKNEDFIKELIGKFVINFILGDILENPLQKEAFRLREKTEQLFPLILKSLKSIAKDKELFEYYTYRELIRGEQISKEILIQRKSSRLFGDKIIPNLEFVRRFQRFFSREISLIVMEYWHRGEYRELNKILDRATHFNPLFVRNENGFADVYYDMNNPDTALQPLFDYFKKNPNKFDRFVKEFEVKQKKISKLLDNFETKSFSKLFDAIAEAWGYLPIWTQFGSTDKTDIAPDMIEISYKLRDQFQDIEYKAGETLLSAIKDKYPKLKEYTDVISAQEMIDNKVPELEELKQRRKGFIFFEEQVLTKLSKEEFVKKYQVVLVDDLATVGEDNLNNKGGDDNEDTKLVRGKVAYPGFARGRVRIIVSKSQLDTIQEGEILVTNMTTPEFVPALKKVVAFITDEGGITSHASIVAREMKKPCVIGTKNATKKLKSGDEVEVDANNGIIRLLN